MRGRLNVGARASVRRARLLRHLRGRLSKLLFVHAASHADVGLLLEPSPGRGRAGPRPEGPVLLVHAIGHAVSFGDHEGTDAAVPIARATPTGDRSETRASRRGRVRASERGRSRGRTESIAAGGRARREIARARSRQLLWLVRRFEHSDKQTSRKKSALPSDVDGILRLHIHAIGQGWAIKFKPTLLSQRLHRSTPDTVWLNPKSRFKFIPELLFLHIIG